MFKILLCQFVVWTAYQSGIVHILYFRKGFKPLCQFQCIGNMTLHSQRQRFQTLNKQEGVERTDGITPVSEPFYPCPQGKGNVAERTFVAKYIPEYQSMVTVGRLCKGPEFSVTPVKTATVYNHTAQRGTMTANPFRSTFNHHGCSVVKRSE